MTTQTLRDIANAAGFRPFDSVSGVYNITAAVQDRTCNVTHFYDPGTLRYFFCKIRKARVIDDGLIIGTICTQSKNFSNTERGYVINFHDLTGHHIGPAAGDARVYYSTLRQAEKAFWEFANALNARDVLRDAIERERQNARRKVRDCDAAFRAICRLARKDAK